MWQCGNISTSIKRLQGGRQPTYVTPLYNVSILFYLKSVYKTYSADKIPL